MRISDWSSDVCSSDLGHEEARKDEDGEKEIACRPREHDDRFLPQLLCLKCLRPLFGRQRQPFGVGRARRADRKSVVSGKSVEVRVDLEGRRIITKKKV